MIVEEITKVYHDKVSECLRLKQRLLSSLRILRDEISFQQEREKEVHAKFAVVYSIHL